MGLIANVIENSGIPTLVAGTVRDIMEQVRSPRAVFIDHPVGRTFGPPLDRQRQLAILRDVLAAFPSFVRAGEIRDLASQWQSDGSRGWEDELRLEILRERHS